MRLTTLLFSDNAKAIYKALKDNWDEEQTNSYGYMIANYCNEMALFHNIEKQLADCDFKAAQRRPLTQARNESQMLLLRLASSLKLSPKSRGDTTTDKPLTIAIPK